MIILQKSHLDELTRTIKTAIKLQDIDTRLKILEDAVLESNRLINLQYEMMVRVAELATEKPILIKQKEVMRLLGGISLTKLRQLTKAGFLNKIQPDNSGAVFFKRSELEDLTNRKKWAYEDK